MGVCFVRPDFPHPSPSVTMNIRRCTQDLSVDTGDHAHGVFQLSQLSSAEIILQRRIEATNGHKEPSDTRSIHS